MRIRLHPNRDLLDYFEAVTFESNDLFRIVREQPNGLQAEVRKNLCPETVFAQVHFEPELEVGLYGVEALLLELVSFYFFDQSNATAFLAHVDDYAAAFF